MAAFKSFYRLSTYALILSFVGSSAYVPNARAGEMVIPAMPALGTMVNLSPAFTPARLQGLTINPKNALQLDFLIYKGDSSLSENQKKEEYGKLVKYFLASLTVADKDQWVNLSPYEKGRIIEGSFGKTDMGRDLLAQDYLLKQITSSLMYPESGFGRNFWNKVYERAFKETGSASVPVNTFNKVWIVPDKADVYESGDTVYILNSHLKVMLEEDYVSLNKHSTRTGAAKQSSTVASNVIRDVILPALEKEVNEGKNFASLRQIYSAMILATWYKKALKESLLGKFYADKAKVSGINQDPKANEEIYQQYVAAFKKGVYNYIKEEEDKHTGQMIPRRYFAGGFGNKEDLERIMEIHDAVHPPDRAQLAQLGDVRGIDQASVSLLEDRAMSSPTDGGESINGDLWRDMIEKGGGVLAGLGLVLAVRGYEIKDVLQKYDKDLGVYVIPDPLMEILAPVVGMEHGSAFNSLGHIGLKASTIGLIKAGDSEALMILRHEEAHNVYRREHPSYKRLLETALMDEIYAYLEGFIAVYGREKLFEKRKGWYGEGDWFQHVLDILANEYVMKDASDRDLVVKRLSYAIEVIRAFFRAHYDRKIMTYILKSTSLDEILGIVPLEQEQWLIDAGIQPANHADLRAQWSQFQPQAGSARTGKHSGGLGEATTALQPAIQDHQSDAAMRASSLILPIAVLLAVKAYTLYTSDAYVNIPLGPTLAIPLDTPLSPVALTNLRIKEEQVAYYLGKQLPRATIKSDWTTANGSRILIVDTPVNADALMELAAELKISDLKFFRYFSGRLYPAGNTESSKGDLVIVAPAGSKSIDPLIFHKDSKVYYPNYPYNRGKWDDEIKFNVGYFKYLQEEMQKGAIRPDYKVLASGREEGASFVVIQPFERGRRIINEDMLDYPGLKRVIIEKKVGGSWLPAGTDRERWEVFAQASPESQIRLSDPNPGHPVLTRALFSGYFQWPLANEGVKFVFQDKGSDRRSQQLNTVDREKLESLVLDKAMNAAGGAQKSRRDDGALIAAPGGIDMNSGNIDLKIGRDGKGVALPLDQQDMAQLSRIQGFVPRIIEIRPATSLPILSELKQKLQAQPAVLASAS